MKVKAASGLIISFYNKEGLDRRASQFLSWSPYDRVLMRQINKFKDFFEDQFESDEYRKGVSKKIHLIEEYVRNVRWKFGNQRSRILIERIDEKQYALNCIIGLRLNSRIKNRDDVVRFVYGILETETRNIDCDWRGYYSLGTEDAVLIALADSISCFGRFLDLLKALSFKDAEDNDVEIFQEVLTVPGMNRADIDLRLDEQAIVRLSLKSRSLMDEAIKDIKSEIGDADVEISYLMIGRCVLDVKIPKGTLNLTHYMTDGIFNGKSDFYRKYVDSSRTYWLFSDDIKLKRRYVDGVVLNKENNIQFSFDTNKRYPMSAHILQEMIAMIDESRGGQWADILQKQYEIVSRYLAYYAKIQDDDQIGGLLRRVQVSLMHIQQALVPFTQIPYRNYLYSGSYNEILRAYYGIIDTLLQVGYAIPKSKSSRQYVIRFGVDIEPVKRIRSKIYTCETDDKMRFVMFHLPYEAFQDIGLNYILLTHEVFHYIAPCDRRKRNETLVYIFAGYILLWLISLHPEIYDNIDEQTKGKLLSYYSKKDFKEKVIRIAENCFEDLSEMIISEFNGEDETEVEASKVLAHRLINVYLRYILSECETKELSTENEDKIDELQELCTWYLETDGNINMFKQIADASKEAFCDINLIQLNDYALTDYILLVGDEIIGELNDDEQRLSFDEVLLLKDDLADETILRLGMVFDYFFFDKKREVSLGKFRAKVHKKYEETKTSEDEQWKKIYFDSAYTLYEEYLRIFSCFRKPAIELFDGIREHWESMADKKPDPIIWLNRIHKSGDDRIGNYLEVIRYFAGLHVMEMPRFVYTKSADTLKTYYHPVNLDDLEISTLGEYIETVSKKMILLGAGVNNHIWFRGECNKSFSSLPNLLRDMKDYKRDDKLNGMSLYSAQVRELKKAYSVTSDFPELWKTQLLGMAEHTCFLQHYGGRTTLLDFSQNMLVSLHFAINPERDRDKEDLKRGEITPKIVLFCPERYNDAIRVLYQEHCEARVAYENMYPVAFDTNTDESEMDGLFVKGMSANECIKKDSEWGNPGNDSKVRYPSPLVVRRSNDRVLAQMGTFLAYYLDTPMQNGSFSYVSLQEIQRLYKKVLNSRGEILKGKEFIEEVCIDPFSVKKLRNELKKMGVNSTYVYPELSKIIRGEE